jgi:hypothetical protein
VKQYVVNWVSRLTGYNGQSSPMTNKGIAQSWADEMNQRHPEISHWVEEVELEETTEALAPVRK